MTEAEWMECADPAKMLELLRGQTSSRTLRLFACACCRRIWHLITAVEGRRAVECSERFADREASFQELALYASHALRHAGHSCRDGCPDGGAYTAYSAASPYELDELGNFADTVCCGAFDVDAATYACGKAGHADSGAAFVSDRSAQSDLLRDIFGTSFHPISVDPAWLTPAVVSLATVAYTERELPSGHLDRDRLAVLSDALEEAGCSDAEILGHLRGAGPHVRGCWVIDLLTGGGEP